jgi:hypothetical protein
LIGKPERKRPFVRLMHRRKDSVSMGLKKIGWEIVGWIHLAEDRDQWRAVLNMIMNLWVS